MTKIMLTSLTIITIRVISLWSLSIFNTNFHRLRMRKNASTKPSFCSKTAIFFHNDTFKYKMRHCIVCCERRLTIFNLHVDLDIYKCTRCKIEKHKPLKCLPQNDMITLTLSSGTVQELCSIL